jgi:uncharacterized membrane protein
VDVTFGKLPVILSVFLVSLSLATCGSLALAATLTLYVIKLFKIYEDALADLMKGNVLSTTDALAPFNFHFNFALFHVILTSANIPPLLHWINST